MQCSELKSDHLSLLPKGRPALFYIPTTTKQQKRPAEKLFSVSLTFVNATKKIKGIPL